MIPYYLYERQGDTRVLEEHYAALAAWLDYVKTTAGNIVDHPSHTWGNDWVAIEETSGRLFRTGFYYWAARLMGEIAGVLHRHHDAAAYSEFADDIADAFNDAFFDEERASYGESQSANAFRPLPRPRATRP